MTRKELGEKVGWFDEKIFMSGTEFDMFERMRQLQQIGILATNVDAVCYHDVLDLSLDMSKNLIENYISRPKRMYYYQRNKGLLAVRYGTLTDRLLLGFIFYPMFFCIYSGIFLSGFKIELFLENFRGVIQGYQYLLKPGQK